MGDLFGANSALSVWPAFAVVLLRQLSTESGAMENLAISVQKSECINKVF